MTGERMPASNVYDIVERLAQLWIVAKCRCNLRRSKSESHLKCFHMDDWIAEEFRNCAQIAREIEELVGTSKSENGPDSPIYAESLDSLQAESCYADRRF